MGNRYGPQTVEVEALLERARNLTDDEVKALRGAWDDARAAMRAWGARAAARYAAHDAAWDVRDDAAWTAREAAWGAWDAGSADWAAAWHAVRDGVQALVVRDLIGQHGFTQEPVSYTHLTLPTICSV